MNLVRRASQQIERRMSLSDFDRTLDSIYGGSPTYTGKLVSQQTALQVAAVWACVGVLADDLATLPLAPYIKLNPGLEPATDHYLHSLLQYEANPFMTSWRFKQLMQTWLGLWGNAYAEIEMNGRGQVTALWPWRPDRVKIFQQNGGLFYRYVMRDGTLTDPLPHEHVLHLRGLGVDGLVGLSPIEQHKQSLGLSMAMTEHEARLFSNGAVPLGVIEHPGKLSEKAEKSLRESWMAKHEGVANAHRLAILEEGLKYREVGLTMVKSQFSELQKYTAEDIARIYKVPQHRIGLLDRSTNNNIEQQSLEYVLYTLGPWASNWEQELEFSLLSPRDRDSICARFKFRSLLRGDMKSQGEYYGAMVNNGVMTQNDVRQEIDLNPLPNRLANVPWKQGAQVPAGDDYNPPQSKSTGPIVAETKPNGKIKELQQ